MDLLIFGKQDFDFPKSKFLTQIRDLGKSLSPFQLPYLLFLILLFFSLIRNNEQKIRNEEDFLVIQ